MGGFQLLDIHDFPGQGTAHVGILDTFWDNKGFITAKEFRDFCNDVVVLAKFEKRIYKNKDSLSIRFDLANYYAQIQKRGLLPTPQTAEHWSEAVLRTLSLNIDRGTKKRLAEALPEELATDLTRTFWLLHFRDKSKSRDAFLKEVARMSGNTDAQFALYPTRAVFHGVKGYAGQEVSDDVAESLAPEISELWQQA